ncbi:MAG: alkaline phosphatase family protein [Clostridia bacterium]|nr:alkaline phosphatase family protein [Clostridia bacterium]
MKNRHVIVVSVDAMVYEDVAALSKMSVFRDRWPMTARVDRVKSIYPTITYPCHTTMQTGVYPDKHGIVNNERAVMGEKSSLWQHERSLIKSKTIFDWAKEQRLTTAAVFWPVTGHDASIDYLVNEYWPQTADESTYDCFANSGSSPEVMEKVIKPNLHFVENRNRRHPWADAFVMNCACSIIREFKPNLLMIHPANVDAYRHETGLFTDKVMQGLYETNLWLEELIKTVDDVGLLETTDFFIVSDHGQMSVRRCIALNVKFAEAGLIDVGENNEIRDWKAFCKSGGMSALVYLKNPDCREDYEKTKALLDYLCAEEVYGISRVYTREEAVAEERLDGDFSFALETDNYTTFSNDWQRPLVRELDNQNYRLGRATHGYLPDKGPQPTLIAFGPHIRAGAVLTNARLIDEAPTFAKVLGIDMQGVDGRCLYEILRESDET